MRGGHSAFALLCSIFNFFVPLHGISEMLVDRGCGGAGRGGRKAESSTNTRLQADSQSDWEVKTQRGFGGDAGCYDRHTNTSRTFQNVYYSKEEMQQGRSDSD